MTLISVLGLMPWLIYVLLLKIYGAQNVLGGGNAFLLLYPLCVLVYAKYKEFRYAAGPAIVVISALIAFNHIVSIFASRAIQLNGIIIAFIISIPLSWIMFGFLILIYAKAPQHIRYDNHYFSKFYMYCNTLMVVSLFVGVLLLQAMLEKGKGVLLASECFLGNIIFSGGVFLYESFLVRDEIVDYFFAVDKRYIYNSKRLLLGGISGFIVYCSYAIYSEYQRGLWFAFIESQLIFLILSLLIYRYTRIMFGDAPIMTFEPNMEDIASLSNSRSVFLAVFSFIAYIAIWLYIA